MLAVLALLLAPMSVAEASAAVPGHTAMMAKMDHCPMPARGSSESDRMAAKICCMSMSMAVTVAASEAPRVQPSERASIVSPPAHFHFAFLGEIATPPPRLS
jgi:hypothetical protein